MREPAAIAGVVGRIVAAARVASPAAREELRRELWTHFEESGASPEAVAEALRRFGSEDDVARSLRRVYRWDYYAAYSVKIVVSLAASCAAALLIVALVNLRVSLAMHLWGLAPGFSRGAGLSVAVALGLVGVREAMRPPVTLGKSALGVGAYAALCALLRLVVAGGAAALTLAALFLALGVICARVAPPVIRWPLMCLVFAGAHYGVHAALAVALPPARAAMAGALLVAVWAATASIAASADHAFQRLFQPARD